MVLSNRDYVKILQMGIALTTERDNNKWLESVVDTGMSITNCDAGILYLYQDNVLQLRILRTISQGIDRGRNGQEITDIPPVIYEESNICAYAAIHNEIINIENIYHSDKFDFSGQKTYDAMTGFQTQSILVVPLEDNVGNVLGVLQMMNAKDWEGNIISFDSEYEIIIGSLGSLAAIELTNIQYVDAIKIQLRSFVEAMATAIDARTPYNGNHTRKVAQYALMLADEMNKKHKEGKCEESFDLNRRERLELAALLHDIGKMIIPKSVMNRATRLDEDIQAVEDRFALLDAYYEIDGLKGRISEDEKLQQKQYLKETMAFIQTINNAGVLTDDKIARVTEIGAHSYQKTNGEKIDYLTPRERECLSVQKGTLTEEDRKIMESHVTMTAKILEKVRFNKFYEQVPVWASEHHEFLDGSGYPNHLKAEDLSLETRILTVSDIYDALTAKDRPYKPAMPKEKAFAILHTMVEEGKLEDRLVNWLEEAITNGEEEKYG